MLKILIYDTNFVPGISRIIPIIKIKYWQKHNCQITIFGTKEAEKFYRTQLKNIKHISLDYKYNIKGPYSLIWENIKITTLVLLNLKRLIGRFDIVYSQSSVIDFLFVPWLLKIFDKLSFSSNKKIFSSNKKIKWFVMVDNIVPPPHKRPGPFMQKLIPYLAFLLGDFFLKNADGIFVVTDSIKNHYEKLGAKKVIKTNDGYGIETEIFKGRIAQNTPKVDALYCGRLHVAKGVMDLVEVAKLVVLKKPDFKMGILGDGDKATKSKFLEKIGSAGLKNNFWFFGYIGDKRKGDIIRNCRLFISLSYDEGFGHAILEALACNKLVVAYDLSVYHEVFAKYIDQSQLILFKEKDFSKIANFILKKEFNGFKFNNKLRDYTWNIICKKELESFLETEGVK